jgi:glycerol-3-phosphate dehydrogenase
MSVSATSTSRLAALAGERFDVLIIGGGIIGAGIARDAALRGLRVALFEKADFGSGTTAGSTRLIHGGLRYLEMLDFGLVRLDLRERETLLRIAPHLVKPLEFIMPFYGSSLFYRCKMKLGMTLYDLLSYDKRLPGHRFLTAAELETIEPSLCRQGLQGALAYWDAQANSPERLCLENLIDARDHGARTFNYAEVTGALYGSDLIEGIRVRDLLSDDRTEVGIKGRVIVNASGPWFDRVAGKLTEMRGAPQIRTTKGVHIACSPVANRAMVVFSHVDGRLMFVIPWLGHSWIGTTETEFADDPATARATSKDVDYILRSVAPYFPSLDTNQILFSNAGVRALAKGKSGSSNSRRHRIADGTQPGAGNLVSVLGGKITGYRAIAEEVVDAVCGKLNTKALCSTAKTPLPGARGDVKPAAVPDTELEDETIRHLFELYGSRATEVIQLAASAEHLRTRLSPYALDVAAQVIFAARTEQCARLVDFLLRRTLLGFSFDQGQSAVASVASLLAEELAWPPERKTSEIDFYRDYIIGTQEFRAPGSDSV